MTGTIRIGTSGWVYGHWREVFYPRGLPQSRWFGHYARLVFFGSAIPYNIIAGVIAGFVATYFTYKFLPRPELTEPLAQGRHHLGSNRAIDQDGLDRVAHARALGFAVFGQGQGHGQQFGNETEVLFLDLRGSL